MAFLLTYKSLIRTSTKQRSMKGHMNRRKHQASASFPFAQVKIFGVIVDSSPSLTLHT